MWEDFASHLAGETIDPKRAHRRAQRGELLQLVRGVYIEQGDSADALVLRHAVRIAHYLYPQAYLASASAVLLGPTRDGRLFLAGRRNQRTRLRALEIVQNEAPTQPSSAPAIIADDLGELRIAVSSPRQRFLEAFRLRSEHASAIDPELRRQFAERLIAEYGTPQAAADALWALARQNQWYRRHAHRSLLLRGRRNPALRPRASARRRAKRGLEHMIRVKRTYEPPARGDGQRILVERLPRGVKKEALAADAWMKEVAPSTQLRKWFDHRVDRWEEFRRRYWKELDANPAAWKPILRASQYRTVTLLYSARDTLHNGALALREYLAEHANMNGKSERQ